MAGFGPRVVLPLAGSGLDGKWLYWNTNRQNSDSGLVAHSAASGESEAEGLENMSHGATQDLATRPEAAIVAALGQRSVVLVGMMGAGKSSIGRRVALRLGVPFVDADTEIEKAAQMNIPDILATRGEAAFRAGGARRSHRLPKG